MDITHDQAIIAAKSPDDGRHQPVNLSRLCRVKLPVGSVRGGRCRQVPDTQGRWLVGANPAAAQHLRDSFAAVVA